MIMAMENGWVSVDALFEAVNTEEYVILRNHQSITKRCLEGEDLDILCRDKDRFVNRSAAKPLANIQPCYNYYTTVGSMRVLMDIRTIGDGYYDAQWELNMLQRRVPCKNYYVLSDVDYPYSLLYHMLLHKRASDTGKYERELKSLFGEAWGDLSVQKELLYRFMQQNGYRCTVPSDTGVYLNRENFLQM